MSCVLHRGQKERTGKACPTQHCQFVCYTKESHNEQHSNLALVRAEVSVACDYNKEHREERETQRVEAQPRLMKQ
jgi:hypothetical protein